LPRPYSVSVSLLASADPFIVTLQAIQKHFRNRNLFKFFLRPLHGILKTYPKLDQRKISTGSKSRRTLKKKEQYTQQANSNLPGESIARERPVCVRTRTGRKSIVFANKGKSPLFYKKQYQK